MANYIYNKQGQAVGFWAERYVYDMEGEPIGQINQGTHVHKITGEYIGELFKNMIVDQCLGDLGNVGNAGDPGNTGAPGDPGNRGLADYGFENVFNQLI